MKTPNVIPSERMINKYLEFLKEVHSSLEKSEVLCLRDLAIKHHINKNVTNVIKKAGLVIGLGNKNSGMYKWNTILPKKQMAIKVVNTLNERAVLSAKRTRVKKMSNVKDIPTLSPKEAIANYIEAITELQLAIDVIRLIEKYDDKKIQLLLNIFNQPIK